MGDGNQPFRLRSSFAANRSVSEGYGPPQGAMLGIAHPESLFRSPWDVGDPDAYTPCMLLPPLLRSTRTLTFT